jgi:soluble lytic murein transglycosylase-like protein
VGRVVMKNDWLARLLLAPLLLSGAAGAHADVYSFVADDGVTHFSDSPNDPRYRLLMRLPSDMAAAPARPTVQSSAPQVFEREITEAAHLSQVEPELLRAVIAVESNYNPRAVSKKGALGLMQLMPATARAYGVTNAWDAQQNIRGGAQHLRMLLDRLGNNKSLALAAYNAGLGAVLAYGRQVPPFAETRAYVPSVLQRYQHNLARSHGAE